MIGDGALVSVALNAIATAVLARVAWVAWQSDRPNARSLAALAGALVVWGLLAVAQTFISRPIVDRPDAVLEQADQVTVVLDTIGFVVAMSVPVLWLLYVYAYTGRERRLTALTATPVVVGIALVAAVLAFGQRVLSSPNEITSASLLIASLFLLELVVLFAVVVYAAVLLVRVAREHPRVSGVQVAALTGAVVAPYVADPVVPSLLRLAGGPVAGVATSLEGPTAGLLIAGGLLTVAVRSYPVLTGFPRTDAVARSHIVADLQEAVVVVDYDDRVLDLNAAACETFATTRAAPVGESIGDVIDGIDAADLTAGRTGTVALRTAEGRRQFEFSVSPVGGTAGPSAVEGDQNGPGGSADAEPDRGGHTGTGVTANRRRHEEGTDRLGPLDTAAPAPDQSGSTVGPNSTTETESESVPIARAVLLRDVTDRRTREQQLSVLNRVLRHNLRNDLDVVLAHAERIEDDDTRAVVRETATDLVALGRKARRAQSVMTACTDPPSTVDLSELARSVAAEHDHKHDDATVETVGPERLPVSTHPDVLRQALDELVENAITHAEAPSVELRVSEPSDTAAAVAVADDGPGIPERERAVLQGSQETQIQHATGIGLWFVAWAVTQLGGDLRFTENDPHGSVVTIQLYDTPTAPTCHEHADSSETTRDVTR
jgi:signal transduction histidine kinase